MKDKLQGLLQKHWGYSKLRPAQEEIIEAVLQNRDVLAVLPTGAGKSLCFQLPSLCRPGLVLVISPLIALMQEQVAELQARHISAAALDATLPLSEVEWVLRQAASGKLKCMYLSPERLQQATFVEKLARLPIHLLTVDEAHCVSAWGHDFRPAYSLIGSIRQYLAGRPLLALTATATTTVRAEIIRSLQMQDVLHLQQSLERSNFSYSVFCTKKKAKKAQEILSAVDGPAIIYAPTRKSTETWSRQLQKAGLSTAAYHAGLSITRRNNFEQRWTQNKTRVLVATSALGMGVDRSDLALVIHVCVPESLSSYYQETGRAGRRGQKAYAVLLYDSADLKQAAELVENRIPTTALIRRVYQALGNYYKIAVGSGAYYTQSFDIKHFTSTYRLPRTETYYALQWLLAEEQILLSDGARQRPMLRILVDKATLYKAEVARPELALLTQGLLRRYGGRLYDEPCFIDESEVAERTGQSRKTIQQQLKRAQKAGLIHYSRPTEGMQITFLSTRKETSQLPLNTKAMQQRQASLLAAHEAVREYLSEKNICRQQALLTYFGEKSEACHRCDLCQIASSTSKNKASTT